MDKIENYTEQALFYARSNTVEKDYIIKNVLLKEMVNNVIIRNKQNLINNNISVDTQNLEITVYTDAKWCEFIFNEIIQNCIKYSKKENNKIEIYAKANKESVILYIKDNGIGINEGDVIRVFEKGFTGVNGRKSGQKSTGIGLYLCKKLCDKLGLKIELSSVENVETEIRIVFPKSTFLKDVC